MASRENGVRVTNEIILHSVGEREVADRFTCQAVNNNDTKPIEVSFRIGVNFPPKTVNIMELPKKVYAGRTQSIRCVVQGSAPSAVITWWKDGQYLERPPEFVEENRTVSSVLQVKTER